MPGPRPVALLHTAETHIRTFSALFAELAPDIPVDHAVRADLLRKAELHGGLTPEIRREVCLALLSAADRGAPVVLCTCSTLGPAADTAAALTSSHVVRVDRPMIERALAVGTRVTVAACVPTTIAPTRALVQQVAAEKGLSAEIDELLIDGAWPLVRAGDLDGYARRIADTLCRSEVRSDVVVLAQASMAAAAELCNDLGVPVLASPRPAVEAAVGRHRGLVATN